MSARYKIMGGCECCVSNKTIHSSLLSWRDRYLKKTKDKIQNAQNRRSGEKLHQIYETYKNTVMPHGHIIYAKASDTTKAKICIYPHSDHSFPHWNFVLRCCSYFLCINIPVQEIYKKHEETTPSIRFHVYRIISSCTAHGIISLKDKKICDMCRQESSSDGSRKIYTRKELVMMEKMIYYFHTSFAIISRTLMRNVNMKL